MGECNLRDLKDLDRGQWNGMARSAPLLEDSKSKCESISEKSAEVLLAELCLSAESSSE